MSLFTLPSAKALPPTHYTHFYVHIKLRRSSRRYAITLMTTNLLNLVQYRVVWWLNTAWTLNYVNSNSSILAPLLISSCLTIQNVKRQHYHARDVNRMIRT